MHAVRETPQAPDARRRLDDGAPIPFSAQRVAMVTLAVLAGILLLCMIYVLSYSPVRVLSRKGYVSEATMRNCYAPLIEVSETDFGRDHLWRILHWYEDL